MVIDKIAPMVKNALIKDGWIITDDPFTIKYEDMIVFADLAAEKLFVAEKAEQKIIVEVKSFMGKSSMHEFETALGQYNSYLPLIKKLHLTHKLYLAVGETIYQKFFKRKAVQTIIEWHQLPIIVIDISNEEVVTWIN